jgi:hypothetical protein
VAALRRRPAHKPYSQERVYRLWSLLLTELWSRIYLDGRGTPPVSAASPSAGFQSTRANSA